MTTVALLGGSGRLGARVLAALRARNCDVRALAHRSAIGGSDRQVTIVRGDVHDRGDLARLLDGADMVVSTLGSANESVPDICSTAIANIVPLMSARKMTRIVSTTGSAARLDSEIGNEQQWLSVRRSALMRHMAPLILDAEAHMRILVASHLDWTILRAPIMRAGAGGGARLADEPAAPDTMLNYDCVADVLVAELFTPRWIGGAPFVVPA